MAPEVILRKIIDGTLTEFEDDGVKTVAANKFANHTGITRLSLPNCTSFNMSACGGASNLETLYIPRASSVTFSTQIINGTKIATLCLPSMSGTMNGAFFQANTKLRTVDLGTGVTSLGGNLFYGCTIMKTLILRRTTRVGATNSVSANIFGNTSGMRGSDATIYIPKVLYDHLGDGTSSDYKAATNWSTISALSTQWAAIEGSQYEFYYADGTPVPQTITLTLTNCTSSNTATKVDYASAYTTTITADEGYALSSVTVTNGGTDVTSAAYNPSSGVVSIDNVAGAITITATAE